MFSFPQSPSTFLSKGKTNAYISGRQEKGQLFFVKVNFRHLSRFYHMPGVGQVLYQRGSVTCPKTLLNGESRIGMSFFLVAEPQCLLTGVHYPSPMLFSHCVVCSLHASHLLPPRRDTGHIIWYQSVFCLSLDRMLSVLSVVVPNDHLKIGKSILCSAALLSLFILTDFWWCHYCFLYIRSCKLQTKTILLISDLDACYLFSLPNCSGKDLQYYIEQKWGECSPLSCS